MIRSEDIERAESILKMVAAEHGNVSRQLEHLMVDAETFDDFLRQSIDVIAKHYNREWRGVPVNIRASMNTLLMHFFLVGLVCGREAAAGRIQ